MNRKRKSLALFDLDHTLLSSDTQLEWGEYLADLEKINRYDYFQRMKDFHAAYQEQQLNLEEVIHFQTNILNSFSLAEQLSLREVFIQERIQPKLYQQGLLLIEEHKEKGDDLILITATNSFLTTPIAAALKMEYLIATEEEKNPNGLYTGRINGIPSYQEGKVKRLKEWLLEQKKELSYYENLFFYTDSINDLPLLSFVTHPHVVNPDPLLEEYAKRAHWPQFHFFH